MTSRKVYQTRFLGYAPDPERLHDPRPQLVYQVIEPPAQRSFVDPHDARPPLPWRAAIVAAIVAVTFLAIRAG